MLGYLLAVFSIVVWGVTVVNTRTLLGDFSSLEIMVLRFALAWLILWLMSPKEYKFVTLFGGKRTVLSYRIYAWMGFCGVALYQFTENCAIHFTNASNVAILMSLSPIVTAVMAKVFLKDRNLGVWMWVGSVMAIAGGVLVGADNIRDLHLDPIGDFMMLVTIVCWGVYSLLMDRTNHVRVSPLVVVRKAFFWSLVAILPVAVWGTTSSGQTALDGSFAINLDPAVNLARFGKFWNLFNLVFLGVFASALAFSAWNLASKRLGMVKANIGLYLMPVVGVVAAALFLGERITWPVILGGLLILAGVAVASVNPMRKVGFQGAKE